MLNSIQQSDTLDLTLDSPSTSRRNQQRIGKGVRTNYCRGDRIYEHDAEGNRTRRTDIAEGEYTVYGWDRRSRLASVAEFDDNDTPEAPGDDFYTRVVVYIYDPLDQLVGRLVLTPESGWLSQAFAYDNGQMVLAFRGAGYGALDEGDLSNRYLWGEAVDQLLADEQVDWSDTDADGEVLWAMTDHLGTVRDLVDSDGDQRRHVAFDEFGNIRGEAYYDADGELIEGMEPWAHGDAVEQQFYFTGRYFDKATGLQNNLHRWYDPSVGHWMSEDPIGFAAGDANLYRYVGNQATTLVDPNGMALVVPGPVEEGPPLATWPGRPSLTLPPGSINWPILPPGFPPPNAPTLPKPACCSNSCESDPFTVVDDAHRRRGSRGPGDDSGHHCWAACMCDSPPLSDSDGGLSYAATTGAYSVSNMLGDL